MPRNAARNQWINNVAYQSAWSGFLANDSQGDLFKNNIGFNNGRSEVYVSESALKNGQAPVYRNNLWFDRKDANIGMWSSPRGGHVKPELPFAQWIGKSGERNAISEDPRFVDFTPGREDFHLQYDSPARGAADNGWDLGAFPRAGRPAQPVDVAFAWTTNTITRSSPAPQQRGGESELFSS